MADVDPRVLAWVNSEREARGIGSPLAELPKGMCGSIFRCPIANALDATVDGQQVIYDYTGELEGVDLPEYVHDFVNRFDGGEHPELIEAE